MGVLSLARLDYFLSLDRHPSFAHRFLPQRTVLRMRILTRRLGRDR
jgi:hypothetical protein